MKLTPNNKITIYRYSVNGSAFMIETYQLSHYISTLTAEGVAIPPLYQHQDVTKDAVNPL